MSAQPKRAGGPRPVTLPPRGTPDPANDSVSPATLAGYIRDLRIYARADYVPPRAKAWWLP